jgi:CHAT domain-containing protein/tetratricopeptide (TPR) repeat protein
VRTRADFPEQWATLHNNLGNAYGNRIEGGHAENIEQAIFHYQQALYVRTRADFPEQWATLHNNLGNIYLERIEGSRSQNLEQSIFHSRQALEVRTRVDFPKQWAMIQNNLAIAYRNRIEGRRAQNLEQAIFHYKEALEVRTREDFPEQWAKTHNNLAIAYGSRVEGDPSHNLEQAIDHFQKALEVYLRSDFPEQWAVIQNNLGDTYLERIEGDKTNNVEQAIKHLNQALEIYSRTDFPVDWAMTQHNLALAYQYRTQGDSAQNLEAAINCFQHALEIYTPQTLPASHRLTQYNLGDLYFNQGSWREAQNAFSAAIAVGIDLLKLASSETGRQAEVEESSDLYIKSAYCLLQLGDADAALVQLEAGKTRLLSQALALSGADLALLSESQIASLQLLRQRIRALEIEYRLPLNNALRRSNVELSMLLLDSRKQLNELIGSIRSEHTNFMSEGLDLEGILSIIPERTALVAPLFTSQGSLIFVLPQGIKNLSENHVIHLDNFIANDLDTVLQGQDTGWIQAYRTYQAGGDLSDWLKTIDALTGQFWDIWVSHVHARLSIFDIDHVIFLPQRGLGLLPIHAAWWMENATKRYFSDVYNVSYVPSAYVLDVALRRLTNIKGQSALVAGVSNYNKLKSLQNVRMEIEAVSSYFNVKPLLNATATRQAILETVKGKAYIHLSCHGSFAWGEDPLSSSLYLADDEPLTLSDVIGQLDLDASRLVTLSGCETGVIDISKSADEYIGLPTGFIQAGTPGIISSLWTVDDRSTALMMERFYHYHLDVGMNPVIALQTAQRWLRDLSRKEIGEYYKGFIRLSSKEASQEYGKIILAGDLDDKPYANPYFWAAFTFNGI